MPGVDFYSPSYRASSSDLTVQVSPLGLVELADEEFEVHGPRLNRYASGWAWYLGHHWGYKREMGEPQLVFNYVRAFADYINNFTFGKGVGFRSPKYTEAIIPHLLKRVWEEDNDRDKLLWEIGQLGGVSGDAFIKVAYEEPYADSIGMIHAGKVRIIPINPAFAFPEFHPHDRTRLIRFKLKYRFWGTSLEGTRQVFTYTELTTDQAIEEYINDELINSQANPLGRIPYVHIPNIPISGSPWGLSDVSDLIPLNREYNEKATEISDIVNYYSAPVTVITGARASNLERGAKKVWAIPSEKARVENLGIGDNLAGPLQYLELVKRAMHELVGVPELALGEEQPISNTSGVALSIQYQPLVNRYNLKKIQYTKGLKEINALIILTLALKEPQSLQWNPDEAVEPRPDELRVLNPLDPGIYETSVHWPSPLPIDVLIKLNEIQVKMGMGLMSKRGALRELGEEFPDELLQEVFEELTEDTFSQGALDLLRAQINQTVLSMTQMLPDGTPFAAVAPAGGANVNTATQPPGGASTGGQLPGLPGLPNEQGVVDKLLTQAYGTKLAQHRNPAGDSSEASVS